MDPYYPGMGMEGQSLHYSVSMTSMRPIRPGAWSPAAQYPNMMPQYPVVPHGMGGMGVQGGPPHLMPGMMPGFGPMNMQQFMPNVQVRLPNVPSTVPSPPSHYTPPETATAPRLPSPEVPPKASSLVPSPTMLEPSPPITPQAPSRASVLACKPKPSPLTLKSPPKSERTMHTIASKLQSKRSSSMEEKIAQDMYEMSLLPASTPKRERLLSAADSEGAGEGNVTKLKPNFQGCFVRSLVS